MKRRELLQGLALAGAWAGAVRPARGDAPPEKGDPYAGMGRVVLVHHPGATDSSYRVNVSIVTDMIEAGLLQGAGDEIRREEAESHVDLAAEELLGVDRLLADVIGQQERPSRPEHAKDLAEGR